MHFMSQKYAEVHIKRGTSASQWCNQKERKINTKVKNTAELVATAGHLTSANVCLNS